MSMLRRERERERERGDGRRADQVSLLPERVARQLRCTITTLIAPAGVIPPPSQQPRQPTGPVRLDLLAQRQAPGTPRAQDTCRVRVAAPGRIALRKNEKVLGQRRQPLAAQRTAIGRRLGTGGGTDGVPAGCGETVHHGRRVPHPPVFSGGRPLLSDDPALEGRAKAAVWTCVAAVAPVRGSVPPHVCGGRWGWPPEL